MLKRLRRHLLPTISSGKFDQYCFRLLGKDEATQNRKLIRTWPIFNDPDQGNAELRLSLYQKKREMLLKLAQTTPTAKTLGPGKTHQQWADGDSAYAVYNLQYAEILENIPDLLIKATKYSFMAAKQ